MAKRNIVRIDEEKCNGCGACLVACPEGALALVEGKARLVRESYCDGLGACLGACPQGALTIEEREAEAYDAREITAHPHPQPAVAARHQGPVPCEPEEAGSGSPACSCAETSGLEAADGAARQWPVQLYLISPTAPYFRQADLLVVADCVPFIYERFHQDLAKGRVMAVGCPKLDNGAVYRQKLQDLVAEAQPRRITVAYTEVACCHVLVRLVQEALAAAARPIPLETVMVGIDGEVQEHQKA